MTEETKELLEVVLANRLFVYSLFHKIFGRDPDAQLMDIICSETAGEAFALISENENDILSRAAAFFNELKADNAAPDFLDKLKSEYTRLFIGPVKLVAPPWESVYRGKEAMLFQECTLEVRRFYKSFGMIPEGYPHVADDSLALEMAFLSKLAERSVKAFADGDTAELKKDLAASSDFLEEHLLVWIPKFLEKMKDSATDFMYPQMCLILDSFLKRDYDILVEDLLPALD